MEQLVEAWRIAARIPVYVLESLQEEQLSAAAQAKGRTVGDHFAHMHNVRLMWLKAAAPELMQGLDKVEKEESGNKSGLLSALRASGDAVAKLFEQSVDAGGKVKGFKPNATGFLGYLASHESFHMGKVDLILRLAGTPMDDKIHYGMWEWGSR